MSNKSAYRGHIFYFKDTATLENLPTRKDIHLDINHQYTFIEDGVLIIENGMIQAVGTYSELKNTLDGISVTDYKNCIITPGFIDTHQHASQNAIVAAYGEKLLEWLENYVFPAESSFINQEDAQKELRFFIDQLIKNGTTTAASYGPLFYEAADIFFEELARKNLRFITGNIMMDVNSPDSLRLSTQENYDNSIKLINKWHNKHRLSYAISPRFALATSEKMLELSGALKREYPDCYLQTHIDENTHEIEAVKKMFPWSKNYLDVYDTFGIVTNQTIFGHCIHTSNEELERFKSSGAIISWCPISNNFLGSGLFNVERAFQYTDKITLGTDWGAGNSLSMFSVMDDAYKVSMLNNVKLPSMKRWYMATLGAAKALGLENKIGTFKKGHEADFIVIDPDASEFLSYRRKQVEDIFDLLFILMTLGSSENIKATYVYGNPLYIKA